MQSRLAIAAARLNRLILSGSQKHHLTQRLGCTTTTGRTADPAEHAVDHDEVYPTEAIEDEKRRHPKDEATVAKDHQPYVPPKSPIASTPKIEHPGIGPQTDPILQQKRRISTNSGDIVCAAGPEAPAPADTDRKRQEEDNVEYFKHHKASALSEIEIADTRKPITRATDGTVQNEIVGKEGTGFVVWRPEQLDTAEDSLRRAAEIFRWNAVRGDPDSPHGRVLRELRGEYW
ncbi:histidinol phosphate aminotransferase 1 [Striga asiatica]|uniref:Histidinol phosphate aminotransferase 1 n=1 Tax=Striga asiatica TaxID=4170 RepID=A0A5A7QEI0_STRAF|nr:histidinol phosphate aminotransferase 1 [Striga asiatica]